MGDFDARKALVQVGVEVRLLAAEILESHALASLHQQDGCEKHGQNSETDQGEAEVEHQHEAYDEHEAEQVGDEVDQPVGEQIRQRIDVVHHPDEDFPVRA